MLSAMSLQNSEIAHLKAKEAQLIQEVHLLQDKKRKLEEDMVKPKNAHTLQLKEAQEMREVEQYSILDWDGGREGLTTRRAPDRPNTRSATAADQQGGRKASARI